MEHENEGPNPPGKQPPAVTGVGCDPNFNPNYNKARIAEAQMRAVKTGVPNAGTRISAESSIRHLIETKVREIQGLDALLRALPRELSYEAEEALWRLVNNQR